MFWGAIESALGASATRAISSTFETVAQDMTEMVADVEVFVTDVASDIAELGEAVGSAAGLSCGAPTKAQLASNELQIEKPERSQKANSCPKPAPRQRNGAVVADDCSKDSQPQAEGPKHGGSRRGGTGEAKE